MSTVTSIERTLHAALDALQLELAVVAISAGYMLEGKPVPCQRTLRRAWMRLGSWHWHEGAADMLPRIREAGGIAGRFVHVSRRLGPAGIPLEEPARAEVTAAHAFIEQLRRDVAERKFAEKAKQTPSQVPPSRARAFVDPDSTDDTPPLAS